MEANVTEKLVKDGQIQYDAESLDLLSIDATLVEPEEADLKEELGENPESEKQVEPEQFRKTIVDGDRLERRRFWSYWMRDTFAHVMNPKPLFETTTVEKSGITAEVVHKESYGRNNRAVLSKSHQTDEQIETAAKAVCIQHIVTSEKPPARVVDDIPFLLSSFDAMRIRDFVEQRGIVWVDVGGSDNVRNRTAISADGQLAGIMYFMYVDDPGQTNMTPIPKYIGICRRESLSQDGLNCGFKKATQESVLTRWGYGQGKHLGDLSAAFWSDQYDWKQKDKYDTWADDLFCQDTRILSNQVYLEVVPWFSPRIAVSEEKLIRLASEIYGEELLNVEYTHDS